MADILTFVVNNCVVTEVKTKDSLNKMHSKLVSIYQEETFVKVEEMISKMYDSIDPKKHCETIRKIVDRAGLLSVFKVEDLSKDGDLDNVMLKAILKSKQLKRIEQLKLALLLDRVDVAREEIYTQDAEFETEDLNELFFRALLEDNTGFVKLLLEKGINLNHFLTVKRILELYNHPLTLKRNKELHKVAKKKGLVSLKHVGRVICEMTEEKTRHIFLDPPYKYVVAQDYFPTQKKSKRSNIIAAWHKIRKNETFCRVARKVTRKRGLFGPKKHEKEIIFEDPNREIFFWSILACKTEISLIFWERGYNSMFLAMLAQHITSSLHAAESDCDRIEDFQNQIDTYEKLAYEVLNECYETDQRKATLLLMSPLKEWDDVTLLGISEQANNESFVQHFVVQKLLTSLWFGNIDTETSYFTILITCFLPILAPFVLKFRKIDVEKMVHSLNEDVDMDFEESESGSEMSEVEEIELKHKKVNNNVHRNTRGSIHPGEPRKSRAYSTIGAERAAKKPKQNCCSSCVGNYFKRFISFFNTPVIKFCYHCISHFCLLILFSFILLTQFFPTIEWYEIALTIWVGTILLEEIRQLSNGNTSSLRNLFKDYITDVWNVMDFISIFLYITGFVLRMIPIETCTLCFYSGRILLALSLLSFFLRVLRFFSIHQDLGPFLVMIQKMLIHIFYFFDVIIVMVLSYGIATTTIKFPNHGSSYLSFLDIILAPWFVIQQAFLPDSCQIPEGSTLSQAKLPAIECAIEGLDPDKCWGRDENCSANNWLVPIMSAFYILLTNVMMLNLLIAMISDTYMEVSSKTELVWSMQRFQLIQEYHERPSLPPPFILFEHIYIFLRKLCPKKPTLLSERTKFDFCIELPNLVRRNLLEWELLQAESYRRATEIDEDGTTSSKIKEISKSVETMNLRITKYSTSSILSVDPPSYSQHDLSFTPEFPPKLYERFVNIEKELEDSTNLINMLLEKFPRKTTERRRPISCSPVFNISGTDIGKKMKKEFIDSEKEEMQGIFQNDLNLHCVCRLNFSYENTTGRKVYRAKVSDFQVPFDVPHPYYRPEVFTDALVLETPFADPDIISDRSQRIKFNAREPGLPSRISLVGEYKLVNGLPMNPMGRTGLRGRGVLMRWGPNRVNKAILVRWEDRNTSQGLKRLEFLTTVEDDETDVFSVPERINVPDALQVYESLYPIITNILHEGAIRWLLDQEKNVYEGYFDDQRNTDNAWLEVYCKSYAIKTTTTQGIDRNFEFEFSDTIKWKWKRISASLQTEGHDLLLLLRVAKIYGAVF